MSTSILSPHIEPVQVPPQPPMQHWVPQQDEPAAQQSTPLQQDDVPEQPVQRHGAERRAWQTPSQQTPKGALHSSPLPRSLQRVVDSEGLHH